MAWFPSTLHNEACIFDCHNFLDFSNILRYTEILLFYNIYEFCCEEYFCLGKIIVVIKVFVRGEIFHTQPHKTPRTNERSERVSHKIGKFVTASKFALNCV